MANLPWLIKQHAIFKTNVAGEAIRAWSVGVLAGVLAELGVVSDMLRPLA